MFKRFSYIVAGLTVIVSVLSGTVQVGAAPTITYFPIPTQSSVSQLITPGPDGALWFSEGGSSPKIGRITTAGTFTEFPVPGFTNNSIPKLDGLTTGPDGNIWFTAPQERGVGRITTAGAVTFYPTPFSIQPSYITTGPDGALWFSGGGTSTIGRITTAGAMTLYPLPTGVGAIAITTGADGALWFTGFNGPASAVGRITTAGAVTMYQYSPNRVSLNGIALGSDGNIWFTALNDNKVGNIAPNGTITRYALPNAGSEPNEITAGPDGALWFTENSGNRIGRIATSGVISEYPLSGGSNYPKGIVAGSDNNVWFIAPSSNRIGRIVPDPVDTVAPIVTPIPDRQPNANNWYDADVTIGWSSVDPAPSSGTPTTPPPTLAAQEGTHIYTSSQSCDTAGNCATGSATLSIDKTNPTIAYQLNPIPNLMGWNNTQVGVSFTCADNANANQSGVANCPESVVVPTGNGTVSVEGVAVDNAGNFATTTVVVNIDDTTPDIDHVITPAPNANGWNTTNVAVSFTCSDNLSLIFSCPSVEELGQEGVGQAVLGVAYDNAGNMQEEDVVVHIDKTAPSLGLFNWGVTNPKPLTGNATLTVPATDATSGLDRAEYYIGTADPGPGNGTAMTLANQQTNASGAVTGADLTATFGTALATGRYDITVRTQDKAGHWSALSTGYLTVYDAAGPTNFTASKQLRPVFGTDILPGLIEDGQKDKANLAFDVAYTPSGAVGPLSWLSLEYQTGTCGANPQNCHSTSFTGNTSAPNGIDWLALTNTNNSDGTFEGAGTLVVDGITTQNRFRVTGVDANRTATNDQDSVHVYIYALNSTTLLYELHITAENGNWLKIN